MKANQKPFAQTRAINQTTACEECAAVIAGSACIANERQLNLIKVEKLHSGFDIIIKRWKIAGLWMWGGFLRMLNKHFWAIKSEPMESASNAEKSFSS
jgi:hypothetical protein